jgi:hypothetical protein
MALKSRKLPKTAELSAREERLCELLAAGWAIGAACAEAKVSDRQGFTWRTRPAFKARLEALRGEFFQSALGRLAKLTTTAVDKLEDLLTAETTPPAVRLAAARGVIADAISVRNTVELDVRITAIEERTKDEHKVKTR